MVKPRTGMRDTTSESTTNIIITILLLTDRLVIVGTRNHLIGINVTQASETSSIRLTNCHYNVEASLILL